jgi:hypothetical protein
MVVVNPADRDVAPNRVIGRAVEGAQTEDSIRLERPNVYKSFLLTRLLVGIVGVMLPTFILAWDLISDAAKQRPLALRGSLSAYYYHTSPLSDWFVGSLWAIGVGLMVYMGTRKSSVANTISWIAGVAAIVVSLFPTNDGETPPTVISAMHFGAAAVVIVGLGLLCVGFGIYDNERTDRNAARKRWRWIHYLAAYLIFASVFFVIVNSWFFEIWPSHGLLAAEVCAVYAFAISWFFKGWELVEYSRKNRDSWPTPVSEPDSLQAVP